MLVLGGGEANSVAEMLRYSRNFQWWKIWKAVFSLPQTDHLWPIFRNFSVKPLADIPWNPDWFMKGSLKWLTTPKFSSSALKNGGWKTILSYWGPVTFQGRAVNSLSSLLKLDSIIPRQISPGAQLVICSICFFFTGRSISTYSWWKKSG